MTAVFGLVVRTQLTRARALSLAAVGALGVLLALAQHRAVAPYERARAAYDLVEGYGLSLLVPVTALVFAAAALGDPAEDGTLVYLWHRPLRRLSLATGALAGAVGLAVPLAVVPTVAMAAVAGGGAGLVAGAAASSMLAVVAYSTLFLGLGLLVKRALAWGLVYVLIWEGFVARSGVGPARLSVLVYARSVLADLGGRAPPRLAADPTVAVVTPLALGAAALALTVWLLRRADVR
ncbi:MAG TPA: hypothetical protein VFO65_08535 [Acidimicrobiales bacterium]|nr:hypothetical protein [Acidimicrobiales bacterium]